MLIRNYELEQKQFFLKKNKEFLKWYSELLKDNYKSFLNLEEMQILQNKIANWYLIKEPDRKYSTDLKKHLFKDIIDISEYMNLQQLRYRLSDNELSVLDCEYRYKDSYIGNNDIDYLSPKIIINNDIDGLIDYLCPINSKSGIVDNFGIKLDKEYKYFENTLVDNLYEELNKYNNLNIKLGEIKKIIDTHNLDVKVRNELFETVKLRLLSLGNINSSEHRTRSFINDVNEYYSTNIKIENDKKKILK